jgi:hypothetical protein
MLRMRSFLLLFGLIILICSCSSPQPLELPTGADTNVVVTVKQPSTAFPTGSTFSWAADAGRIYPDPRLDATNVRKLLMEAITSHLEARGYRFVDNGGDYQVSFVAALRESLSDNELSERYGINPGMVGDSLDQNAYDKATIITDIRNAGDGALLWRSAMQGFAVFNLDDEERKARVNNAVSRLFSSLP